MFVAVAAGLVLVLAEVATRILTGEAFSSRPVGMPPHLVTPGQGDALPGGLPVHLEPATRPAHRGLPYLPRPGSYGEGCQVNAQLTWGEPVAIPRPHDVIRVVALGASSTQGWCALSADSLEAKAGQVGSYPRFLEEGLSALDLGGLRVEVVNAGVEGYRAAALLPWYHHALRRLTPDVALIYSGWNDLYSDPSGADDLFVEGATGWGRRPAWALLDRSALALQVRRAVHAAQARRFAHRTAASEGSPRESAFLDYFPLDYAERIRALVAELERYGVRPVLVTQATNLRAGMPSKEIRGAPSWLEHPSDLVVLWEIYSETIRGLASELDVELIDAAGCFDPVDRDRLMWDFMHPTTEGYRALARCIADGLGPMLEKQALTRPAR